MYKETIGKIYIKNGQILEIENICNEKVKNNSIYEVIRMVRGVPLFMEDHIIRLVNSASLMGYDIKESIPSIFDGVGKLILGNSFIDGNFKILISEKNGSINYICFFIESHYPDEEMYKNGVPSVLYFNERENPNAKALNLEYKSKTKKILEETKAYEALLVNEKDFLTEGSRSNLFIIIEGCVYTSPGKDVLPGITRQKVLKLCHQLLIPIVETDLHVDILAEADAIFITGTSPKILPISTVNGDIVGSPNNKILHRIIDAYNDEILDYFNSCDF